MCIARFVTSVTLAGLCAAPIGCQGRTYRLGLEMPPDNIATANVGGDRPFVVIRNLGPGPVEVTFDANNEVQDSDTLILGSIGRTLRGSKVITIETGSDAGASVRLEAQHSNGMELDGPVPK